eukprot:contig_16994_g4130
MYEVLHACEVENENDEDDEDGGGVGGGTAAGEKRGSGRAPPSKTYSVPHNQVSVLSINPDLCLSASSRVLAMYPDTTTFYPATVAENAASRRDHLYLLNFDDQEDDGDTGDAGTGGASGGGGGGGGGSGAGGGAAVALANTVAPRNVPSVGYDRARDVSCPATQFHRIGVTAISPGDLLGARVAVPEWSKQEKAARSSPGKRLMSRGLL